MAAAKIAFIPDILEEHYEELQFLWSVRQKMLRSPTQYSRDLLQFEERIEAHLQGLLLAGDNLKTIVGGGMASKDPLEAFATAYPFLRSPDQELHHRAIAALADETGPGATGLKEAFCHGSQPSLLEEMQRLLVSPRPQTAVAAAEALAFHNVTDQLPARLTALVQSELPPVRSGAWRVAGLLGLPLDAKAYAQGLRDDDASVRREVLYAAAWAKQHAILDYSRRIAENPVPDHLDGLRLLAILGSVEDFFLIFAAGQSAALGPKRFSVLGSYGHPGVVQIILDGLWDKDPLTAIAAGQAFTTITGVDIRSQKVTEVPLDPGQDTSDEFGAEFTAPVVLPDVQKAVAHWQQVGPHFARATRMCAGFDFSAGCAPQALAVATLESRWEAALRESFWGRWSGCAIQLERLQRA